MLFRSETVGLDVYASGVYIVSITFTIKAGKSYVLYFKGLHDQPVARVGVGEFVIKNKQMHDDIQWLLNSQKIKTEGANLKYDCRWMKYMWGISCSNFTFDTTLVGSLLDENASNGLSNHAKRYTDMGGYDQPLNSKYDKSRMDLVPPGEFLVDRKSVV